MAGDTTTNDINFSSDPRWLWGVIGAFSLLIAANAVMIYFATADDASKVIGEQPYEMGLRYDEALLEAEQTRATGWSYAMAACEGAALCVAVSDADGGSMGGATVLATLVRPSDPALDTRAPLREIGGGRYALASIPGQGLWELTIDVIRDGMRARWTRPLYLEP